MPGASRLWMCSKEDSTGQSWHSSRGQFIVNNFRPALLFNWNRRTPRTLQGICRNYTLLFLPQSHPLRLTLDECVRSLQIYCISSSYLIYLLFRFSASVWRKAVTTTWCSIGKLASADAKTVFLCWKGTAWPGMTTNAFFVPFLEKNMPGAQINDYLRGPTSFYYPVFNCASRPCPVRGLFSS